jgi:hypothetical protein
MHGRVDLRRAWSWGSVTFPPGFPIGLSLASGACYVAAWPLPRLDSHQSAVDSFRTPHVLVGWQLVIENLHRLQIDDFLTLIDDAENVPLPLPFFQSALVYSMMR